MWARICSTSTLREPAAAAAGPGGPGAVRPPAHRTAGPGRGLWRGWRCRRRRGATVLPARQAVLALGHSARDTFEMLHTAGVRPWSRSPLPWGCASSTGSADMDAAQYRRFAGHPCLPAAGYKLSCHPANGRSAFSFCVCPGRTGGGRRVGAGPGGDQRHERIRPGPGEHQRRPAGERDPGGLRQRPSPGGHRLPAAAGGGGLPPGRRRLCGSLPSGWRIFWPGGPPRDRDG